MIQKVNQFLGVFVLGFLAAVQAQPVLTQSNVPQVGLSVQLGICSDLPSIVAVEAEAGANQNWDYSSFTEVQEQQQSFVNPSSTAWASRYPNANLCRAITDSVYEFLHLSQDSLSMMGVVLIEPSDTLYLDYQNPEIQYPIPSEYGDQLDDEATGVFLVPFEISANVEIDGYGTLMLPNATYQNVVRVHSHSEFEPNVGEGSVTDGWTWFSADHQGPLLTILNVQGAFQVVNMKVWYNKSPQLLTGLANLGSSFASVYPNPCSERTIINFKEAPKSGNQLVVADLSGKEFLRKGATSNRMELQTNETQKGVYLLYLEENGLRRFLSKLVVQ